MAESSSPTVEKPKQKAKITLYWLELSRAQRILWLLEDLNLSYEIKTYKRQNMLAPPELKKIHPLGKSPILSIQAEGMSEPLILAESAAIVEYLVKHFGPHLAPREYPAGKEGQIGQETEDWIRYRYFMHYAEGTIMTYLLVFLVAQSKIAGGIESSFVTPNITDNFQFLESQLATSPDGGDYLCGKELTGADFLTEFPLGASRGHLGFTTEKYPMLSAYVTRLQEMESYKRAVQKIIEVEGVYKTDLI